MLWDDRKKHLRAILKQIVWKKKKTLSPKTIFNCFTSMNATTSFWHDSDLTILFWIFYHLCFFQPYYKINAVFKYNRSSDYSRKLKKKGKMEKEIIFYPGICLEHNSILFPDDHPFHSPVLNQGYTSILVKSSFKKK